MIYHCEFKRSDIETNKHIFGVSLSDLDIAGRERKMNDGKKNPGTRFLGCDEDKFFSGGRNAPGACIDIIFHTMHCSKKRGAPRWSESNAITRAKKLDPPNRDCDTYVSYDIPKSFIFSWPWTISGCTATDPTLYRITEIVKIKYNILSRLA